MAKGPQGAIPVAPSLCSFAGPSWRFRLGPQEMNLSAATLLSQSVETLPPPIPTCHSHDCKLADPRKLPGPSTSQRWDCLPSNQARIRGIEHPQLLSLQPSLRPTAHEYRSFLCLLKTADPGLGCHRQRRRTTDTCRQSLPRHRDAAGVSEGKPAASGPLSQALAPTTRRQPLPPQWHRRLRDLRQGHVGC